MSDTDAKSDQTDTTWRVTGGPTLTLADLDPQSDMLTPAERAAGWRFVSFANGKRHLERPEELATRRRAIDVQRRLYADAVVPDVMEKDACFDLSAAIFADLDRRLDVHETH